MEDHQEEKQSPGIGKILKWSFYGLIAVYFVYSVFIKKDESATEQMTYTEETVLEPTQGVVTTVEEIQAEVFKITDEEVVEVKEDSRIIANYMNGKVDTFTLEEVALVDTTITDRNNPNYGRRMIRSVVIGGAIGYMMGRPMGRGLNRSSYRSDAAYNKSNSSTKTRMTNTASKRTVRKPVARKSTGFGSGKSTRSYGG